MGLSKLEHFAHDRRDAAADGACVFGVEMDAVEPDPAERYGINLGNLIARGELRALLVNANASLRLLSNPFFPYLLERIDPAAREGSLPAATTARR